MNYAKQCNKGQPFEGLTQEEKKRLFVYMCHVAHPSLSPDEIERRWGRVLPANELPTVFEALEIAKDIKREIKGYSAHESHITSTPYESVKENKLGYKGCIGCLGIVLFLVSSAVILTTTVKKQEERQRQEQKQKQERQQQKRERQRQKQEQRYQEMRKEMRLMKEQAEAILCNAAASSEELFSIGVKVSSALDLWVGDAVPYDSEELLAWKELLLQCYKKAIINDKDNYRDRIFAANASYRIALLYMPYRFRQYLSEDDYKGITLSENGELFMKYLKDAADANHYKALSLISKIPNDKLSLSGRWYIGHCYIDVAQYKEKLMRHPNATADDIYSYASKMAVSDPGWEKYMRKAAKMGNRKARQRLLEVGLTIDE